MSAIGLCWPQVGNGANMKLVVNMAMGTMMTTLAESLTLADKSGLSQEQLLEVLGLGVMANPMFKMKVCPCVMHTMACCPSMHRPFHYTTSQKPVAVAATAAAAAEARAAAAMAAATEAADVASCSRLISVAAAGA